ncbi:hypothetical protein A0H76_2196 [Hepatospora eriocheir]|uniref:FAD/NAD(P)-binding domain-containing protein n=1 Tax=Hepatospora eriocheir TaxID=1081669 RepID=A0A1X0QLG6_9MICR|nr:hypothetical protein A0H76_2196 [Hepatospora eriocheir]
MIVLVGNSPATTICAIYLKTANKKVFVIRDDSELGYKTTVLPGYKGTQSEYNNECFRQAINIVGEENYLECKSTEIVVGEKNIIVNNRKIDFNLLVVDSHETYQINDKNIISVVNFMKDHEGLTDEVYNEAIILASMGCKIAYMIKEMKIE